MDNQTDYSPFSAKQWPLAHGLTLILGPCALIMGILNITLDSFSDGGENMNIDRVLDNAKRLINEGAHILDIGGESTRPGADPVTAEIEQERVLPVITALRENFDVAISIDSYRASTALLAISAGAHIVNDVWGLQRDKDLAKVVAKTGAGVCIMHTGRDRDKDSDMIKDQMSWFDTSLGIAKAQGIEPGKIVLDPGFGFAKDVAENVNLMSRFGELHQFDLPILVGTSRKRFIGALADRDVDQRDVATSATSAILRLAGGAIFRVHDVATNKDALHIADAIVAENLRMAQAL